MRGGGWNAILLTCGFVGLVASGCVPASKYQGLDRAHRRVIAEKEGMAKELYDERNVNDKFRSRIASLEMSSPPRTSSSQPATRE